MLHMTTARRSNANSINNSQHAPVDQSGGLRSGLPPLRRGQRRVRRPPAGQHQQLQVPQRRLQPARPHGAARAPLQPVAQPVAVDKGAGAGG
jgi:hypothetical protein